MDYAFYIWNNLPQQDGEFAFYSQHINIFGCPAYVVDPRLCRIASQEQNSRGSPGKDSSLAILTVHQTSEQV